MSLFEQPAGPQALAEARSNIHGETTVRANYRALLDAAGNLPDAELRLVYVKNDGTERVMRCRSAGPGSDATRRYVTVWDLEVEGYRRVALDTIRELTITTSEHRQS